MATRDPEAFKSRIIEYMAAFASVQRGHDVGAYPRLKEDAKEKYRTQAKEWLAAYGAIMNELMGEEMREFLNSTVSKGYMTPEEVQSGFPIEQRIRTENVDI